LVIFFSEGNNKIIQLDTDGLKENLIESADVVKLDDFNSKLFTCNFIMLY